MNSVTAPLPPARFAALVWTLAQRDLKTRFKGTLLGWLWTLIVPLASLAIYSLVFGLIFRAQVEPLGNGRAPIYALWLFGALISFHFIATGITHGAQSLRDLSSVLNRVRLPALAPIIGAQVSAGMQTLVEFGLYLAVLAALGNVGWEWLLLPVWAALLFAFTAGLAATLAVVVLHVRDMVQIVAIALQFLFFMTPVMYPLSMVPEGLDVLGVPIKPFLAHSPIAEFIDVGRDLSYGLETGSGYQWVVMAISAAVALVIGVATVARFGQDAAEQVQ